MYGQWPDCYVIHHYRLNSKMSIFRYTSFCTCLFQMQFDNKGFTPVKMDDLGFTPVQFDSRGFTPVKLPEHEDQGVPDSPFTLISGVSLSVHIFLPVVDSSEKFHCIF